MPRKKKSEEAPNAMLHAPKQTVKFGEMNLADTVEGMVSANYKERFKAEYWQTKIRSDKLGRFIALIEACIWTSEKEPEHDCPLELLRIQKRQMEEYLHTLEIRAKIEGVNL